MKPPYTNSSRTAEKRQAPSYPRALPLISLRPLAGSAGAGETSYPADFTSVGASLNSFYQHHKDSIRFHGAPQVNHAPIDFQIDLVQMPDRMRFGTALAQFRRYDRPEMIYQASDCLVRNCNSALGEQILDVTIAEREPEIEPDRLVNDLRRADIRSS